MEALQKPTVKDLLVEALELLIRQNGVRVQRVLEKVTDERDPVIKAALQLGQDHYQSIADTCDALKRAFEGSAAWKLETPEKAVAALQQIERELERK